MDPEEVEEVEEVVEPVEEVEPEVEPVDIAAAIFADPDDQPEAVRKLLTSMDTALEADGGKSWSIDPAVLEGMPLEVKQLVHNLKRTATLKFTEAAGARKDAEALRAKLEQDRLQLKEEQARLFQPLLALVERVKPPELAEGQEPPSRFTEEGQDYYISKKVSEILGHFLGQVKEQSDVVDAEVAEALEKAQQAAEAARIESEVAELRAVVEEEPEWWEAHKHEVAGFQALRKREIAAAEARGETPPEPLHWRKAIELVKARHTPKEAPEETERRETRRALKRTRTTSAPTPQVSGGGVLAYGPRRR